MTGIVVILMTEAVGSIATIIVDVIDISITITHSTTKGAPKCALCL
jgi:hypothetical protein